MIFITGAGGMVGSHMIDYFVSSKEEVIGTYYKPTINMREIEGKCILIESDVRYELDMLRLISKYRPSTIYHLAAQSYPTVSWERPNETMDINVQGTVNLFEAVKTVKRDLDYSYDPAIIVACSSAEYGSSLEKSDKPITEDAELLPLHPYGVSKVAQDLLSYQYYKNEKIKVIRARIFNTTGPRKKNDVCSDFTRRTVDIERGKSRSNKLMVGNLDSYRSITDVRDLIKALVLLKEKGRWGEAYNICGEKTYQMIEIINIIKNNTHISFEIEVDPSLLRSTDEKVIIGNSEKLINDTRWSQDYNLNRTIYDMLEYWRDYKD